MYNFDIQFLVILQTQHRRPASYLHEPSASGVMPMMQKFEGGSAVKVAHPKKRRGEV